MCTRVPVVALSTGASLWGQRPWQLDDPDWLQPCSGIRLSNEKGCLATGRTPEAAGLQQEPAQSCSLTPTCEAGEGAPSGAAERLRACRQPVVSPAVCGRFLSPALPQTEAS